MEAVRELSAISGINPRQIKHPQTNLQAPSPGRQSDSPKTAFAFWPFGSRSWLIREYTHSRTVMMFISMPRLCRVRQAKIEETRGPYCIQLLTVAGPSSGHLINASLAIISMYVKALRRALCFIVPIPFKWASSHSLEQHIQQLDLSSSDARTSSAASRAWYLPSDFGIKTILGHVPANL